jgi:hypothetical protein
MNLLATLKGSLLESCFPRRLELGAVGSLRGRRPKCHLRQADKIAPG